MHEIGSFAAGRIPTTVVASCRHAFMTDHLLHRRQVGAGVEQPGVNGAMPVAAVRSDRITATPSSASRRSRTPAMRGRPLLYQKVRDCSIRSALSARKMT